MFAGPPATRDVSRVVGGRFVLGRGSTVVRQDRTLSRGSAIKANPAKAGDAKPRGYRTPSRARPVELPNLTLAVGRGCAFSEHVALHRARGSGASRHGLRTAGLDCGTRHQLSAGRRFS